jgi:nucleotide-binding universal stress UspA family protein
VRDARLVVVHAWHTPATTGYPLDMGESNPALFEEDAKLLIEEAVTSIPSALPRHQIEAILVCSGPGPALVERARDADLVVVGSRGRGTVRSLVLGSVSHHVVHHAPCAATVIPPDARTTGL